MVYYSVGATLEGDFMQRDAREKYLFKKLWDWQENSKLAVLVGMYDDLFLKADETSRKLSEW